MASKLVVAIKQLNDDINTAYINLELSQREFERQAEAEGITAEEEDDFYMNLNECKCILLGKRSAAAYLESLLSPEELNELRSIATNDHKIDKAKCNFYIE